MGQRKRGKVEVVLFKDDVTGIYTYEVREWTALSGHHRLAAFLDVGPFGLEREEVQALTDYVSEAVKWLTGDVLALDSGTTL